MLTSNENPSEIDHLLEWELQKFLYFASYRIDKNKLIEIKTKQH